MDKQAKEYEDKIKRLEKKNQSLEEQLSTLASHLKIKDQELSSTNAKNAKLEALIN